MNDHVDFRGWVVSAVALLEHAMAGQNVDRAIQGLTDIGRAEAALGDQSLLTAAQSEDQRVSLARVAGADPKLMARAAANLVCVARRPGFEGLVEALLARSGYQLLLDLGVWSEPPLDDFHLGEVDDELAAMTKETSVSTDARALCFPISHVWWRT